MLHTRLGVHAVEMCVRGALHHCRRHRTVPEGDVIQGGDTVKHAEADLRQSDLERLVDAAQLYGGLVPAPSLVVQSPPYDSVVLDSLDSKVHVRRPHRYARVIVPEIDEGDMFAFSGIQQIVSRIS